MSNASELRVNGNTDKTFNGYLNKHCAYYMKAYGTKKAKPEENTA